MIEIYVTDTAIAIKLPYAQRERVKDIAGWSWDRMTKTWRFPPSPKIAHAILEKFDGEAHIAVGDLQELADKHTVREDVAHLKQGGAPLPDYASKTPPWDHQKTAFWFAMPQDAVMLAMDMGTGKSKVVADLIHHWRAKKVLIICPLSVLGVWPRELARHCLTEVDVRTFKKGSVAKRAERAGLFVDANEALGTPCAIVVNHEAAWRSDFGKFIKDYTWDVIVVDESHRAKDPKGRFSKFLGTLFTRGGKRLMLTGTPMPHSPLDVYAQYRFLDPGIYGTSYHRFKLRYAQMGGFQGKQILSYQREDELNEKFYSIAYRITKDEALDLPEEVEMEVTATLGPKAAAMYADLEKDFYTAVEEGEVTVANALVQLLRLQQLTSGFIEYDEGEIEQVDDAKARLLHETLDDISVPAVVFCRFRRDLDVVSETAASLGRTYGEVSGRRKDLTDDATMPSDIDIMGVQIQAGGVGIDLSRASYALYYSTGFSLGDYKQSMSRVHRPGQLNKVTYIHLVLDATIDRKVYGALRSREQVIEAILKRRNQ